MQNVITQYAVACMGEKGAQMADMVSRHGGKLAIAVVVSSIAYTTLGTLGLVSSMVSLALFYVFCRPVIDLLDRFELKGVTLVVAAFVMPFFGGTMATVSSVYIGFCLISDLWERTKIGRDLSQVSLDLQENNDQAASLHQESRGQAEQFMDCVKESQSGISQLQAAGNQLTQCQLQLSQLESGRKCAEESVQTQMGAVSSILSKATRKGSDDSSSLEAVVARTTKLKGLIEGFRRLPGTSSGIMVQ